MDSCCIEDGKELWSRILGEVQSNSSLKLPSRKNLVVLGDDDSDKTLLVSRLQGIESAHKGCGLEFHYIDVKDAERDDSTKLSTWVLDGDPRHSNLLKFSLTETNAVDTLVLLVVSIAQPWRILDSLRQWSELLERHISRLNLSSEMASSLVIHWQDYVEPDEVSSATSDNQQASSQSAGAASSSSATVRRQTNPLHPNSVTVDSNKVNLPLPDGALERNMGIPLIVVVTKTESITALEKEHGYKEEHFDFIQLNIRKFCLQYGAALFYTSVKEDKNCDLLSRYIQHRIYGFPFQHAAYVVERDSIFVPTGWDNLQKINILVDNLASLSGAESYEEVIARPLQRRAPVGVAGSSANSTSSSGRLEAEVQALDEQIFLMRLQSSIQKGPAPTGSGASPAGAAVSGRTPTSGSPRANAGTPGASRAKVAGGAAPTGQPNEGVLANFFNSLLSKRTGTPGAPTASPPSGFEVANSLAQSPSDLQKSGVSAEDNAAITRESAQAELDRMMQSKSSTTSVMPIAASTTVGGTGQSSNE